MDSIAIPPGIICTTEQFNRTLHNDPSIYCLSRGESIGLTIVAEAAFVSLFAVLFVFVIIFRNVIAHLRYAPRRKIFTLFQGPMDILMLSLFFADLIQATGAIMDIQWVQEGKVEIGDFCTAQGIIQQLGETGVALTTLLIAIYTFIGVWWRIGMGVRSVRVAGIVTCLVWLFIILVVAIGNGTHSDKTKLYQSPTPYWCWIGSNYFQFRIWGEYVWFWITLAFSVLAYTLLFFWSRGNITPNEYSWWKFSVHRVSAFHMDQTSRLQSLIMLAYPIVYSILILPLSIVRWIGFVQERDTGKNTVSPAATFVVLTIYGLSGTSNVILFLTTRPNSILFGHPRAAVRGTAMAAFKTNDIDGMGGREPVPSNDLGRLPSRGSTAWH